jgi:hypothetical protein
MCLGLLAELLQLRQDLHQNFLPNVIGLGLFQSLLRVEVQFVADYPFDYRLDVGGNKLSHQRLSLFPIVSEQ